MTKEIPDQVVSIPAVLIEEARSAPADDQRERLVAIGLHVLAETAAEDPDQDWVVVNADRPRRDGGLEVAGLHAHGGRHRTCWQHLVVDGEASGPRQRGPVSYNELADVWVEDPAGTTYRFASRDAANVLVQELHRGGYPQAVAVQVPRGGQLLTGGS